MSYGYGSQVPDFAVYPDAARPHKQTIGAIAIGALFLALIVGCVWVVIDTREWTILAALPVLGLAMFGLWKSMQGRGLGNALDPLKPVLVLNDAGIGDAYVQIPWGNVAAVDVFTDFNRSVAPPSLGKQLSVAFSDAVGVLDGTLNVRVTVRDTWQLSGTMAQLRKTQGNVVTFDVGSAVPSKQWLQLAEAIRQHVRARGIATQG